MQFTVKTTAGATFTVTAEPHNTILELKKIIQQNQGIAYDAQKLIFVGKILDDSKTIESYNITPSDFVVCMAMKKKPAAPTSSAAPSASSSAGSSANGNSDDATASMPAPPPVTQRASAPVSATLVQPPAPPSSASSMSTASVQGSVSSAAADSMSPAARQLMEMGFEEETVRLALEAANNNPHVALEFLMSEEYDVRSVSNRSTRGSVSTAQGEDMAGTPPSTILAEPDIEASDIGFLRSHPQFNQLRVLVQANPGLLQTILEQIGRHSPELLGYISEHSEEFVRLLNEPVQGVMAPSNLSVEEVLAQILEDLEEEARMDLEDEEDEDELRDEDIMIEGDADVDVSETLNDDDNEAITRLMGLGFDFETAKEAYLLCGRDETMAANYLFDST